MAKKFETNFASGALPSWMKYDMTFNDTAPTVVSGTVFGRTGNFASFSLGAGQKRCEVFSTDYWHQGQWETEVHEFCLDSNFPISTTKWQLIRQYKDLGIDGTSTTPPFSMHQESSKLYFNSYNRSGGATSKKDIINPIKTGVWYVLATEVFLNGPTAGSFAQAGSARALLLVNGVWVEIVPKFFPATTWHTDGHQDYSRWQTGIYHDPTINAAARRYTGYIGTGTGSLLSDFGVEVGGGWIMGGGGGTPAGGGGGTTPTPTPDPGTPTANPVVPVDVAAETSYAATKVGLTKAALGVGAYPSYIDPTTGHWLTTTAAGWTSGFLPALYWRLYTLTNDAAWRDTAIASQAGVAGQSTNGTSAGADLGHRMKPFMRAYDLTGTTSYRDTALTAATTISGGWDPEVGAIRSWASGVNSVTNFNTIIDSATASELLWWAARNGATDATTLRTRVTSHMQKLRAQHVRTDGSTYHLVEWNDTTGAMITRRTIQGLADTSTWARGQAWAIYGFAVAAREASLAGQTTDATDFRTTAVACANYFLNNLPADNVSLWDFNAAAGATKDTSATAIAAAGLFVLSALDTSVNWGSQGKNLVEALAANYHAAATKDSVLDHGTSTHLDALVAPQAGQDTGLIYGDSYYLDALSSYQAAGLGTTKPLANLATDATWVQFPTLSTGAAPISGRMAFTLDATTYDAHADTNAEWVPSGDAAVVGAITFPTWISGSGIIEPYLQLDWLDGNLIEVTRRLTFSAASGNANKVTADTLEVRLLRPSTTGGSADPQPTIILWSALAAGTKYLKVGFPADGVSVQTSVAGTAFVEAIKRAFPATYSVDRPLRVRIGMRRPTPADTIRVQTGTVDAVVGSNSPNPNPGGTVAKTDKALRFAKDTIRVFPFISGTVAGFLTILKPISTAALMAVGGVSKGAGIPPLTTFTQADGALPAPWTGAGGTLPVVAGNAASSGASVTNGRAVYNTSVGSADMSVTWQLTSVPGNPAATVFDLFGVLFRITGTAGTTTGYMCSLALQTNGTVGPVFKKIINGSPQAGLNTSGAYGFKTPTATTFGDWFGVRAVGSTLEAWWKPAGGVWGLWGTLTDTTYTTGNLHGIVLNSSGATVTKGDNYGAWASAGLDEAFPVSRAGRYQRIEAGGQPIYRDSTLVPPGGLGGTTIPSGWSATLEGRATADGHVGAYTWDATTNTWTSVTNAGTIGAGATISDSGARYVIGDREPNALTDQALNADVAAHVVFNELPTLAQAQAIVQPGGAVTLDALKAMPGAIRVYDLRLVTNTDQIVNALSPGTGDEITGERVGTGTVITDTGNVPLSDGTGGGGTAPTPTAAVPDGSGVRLVSSGISTVDPTTATVTLSMDATVADATIGYTPSATAPYQFGYTDGGPDGPITWLAAQVSNTLTRNTEPLSDPLQEPLTRWWTGRYVNNAAVAGNPQRPYVPVVVTATLLQPVAVPVLTRKPVRAIGGTATIWVALPPADQSVDEFHVRLTPLAANGSPSGAQFLAYSGTGSVSGGEVALPLTGLSDAVPDYAVALAAYRTEP